MKILVHKIAISIYFLKVLEFWEIFLAAAILLTKIVPL